MEGSYILVFHSPPEMSKTQESGYAGKIHVETATRSTTLRRQPCAAVVKELGEILLLLLLVVLQTRREFPNHKFL